MCGRSGAGYVDDGMPYTFRTCRPAARSLHAQAHPDDGAPGGRLPVRPSRARAGRAGRAGHVDAAGHEGGRKALLALAAAADVLEQPEARRLGRRARRLHHAKFDPAVAGLHVRRQRAVHVDGFCDRRLVRPDLVRGRPPPHFGGDDRRRGEERLRRLSRNRPAPEVGRPYSRHPGTLPVSRQGRLVHRRAGPGHELPDRRPDRTGRRRARPPGTDRIQVGRRRPGRSSTIRATCGTRRPGAGSSTSTTSPIGRTPSSTSTASTTATSGATARAASSRFARATSGRRTRPLPPMRP